MSRNVLSGILFWSLATVSAVLFVVLMLALGGVLPVDSPQEPRETPAEASPAPAPEPPPPSTEEHATETATVPATSAPPAETRPATTEPTASSTTLVVVTASRGDSWFSARLGSENGRVLDERVLAQGETARFSGTRIWLSIGAAGNVDVTVDGEPRPLSPGTVSLVLTPSRSAAANS